MKDRDCQYCNNPFKPKKQTHKFCSDKCRAAWHREKPFTTGVPVTLDYTKANKRSITIKLHASHDVGAQLASMTRPGQAYWLVPIQKDLGE